QVGAGELVLAAPAWRAGSLADTRNAQVGVDLYEQKWRNGVHAAPSASNRKLRLDWNTNRDRLDAGDFHPAAVIFSSRLIQPCLPFCKFIHERHHIPHDAFKEFLSFLRRRQVGMPDRARF